MISELCRTLDRLSVEYIKDISLKQYSSFRIGGNGAVGVFPDTAEKLANTVSLLNRLNIRYEICGKGSNILFGDGFLDMVIVFTEKLSRIECDGTKITAEAGVSLATLAHRAAENGLTGLEFARGIPGTVGGALFMNAGAYGGAMSDITLSSTALNKKTGEIFTVADHGFGYRESIYMKNKELVCLSGAFEFKMGDKEQIYEKMRVLSEQRREKQPLNFPSAGSYFKRPEGYFAGKLIEDAGLKGMRVGDAAVSEKHAGFIINLGNASASDILTLEDKVKNEVLERFGVMLEREVRVIR